MKQNYIFLVFSLLAISVGCVSQPTSQEPVFTHADTLRGSITAGRDWWDLLHYTIELTPDYQKKFISGTNRVRFKVIKPSNTMQIDLQEPMTIREIQWRGKKLSWTRDGNAFFVRFPENLKVGQVETIKIAFEGNPIIAKRPPWEGGWTFTQDKLGRPWMTVTCEGLGASVWLPCKDYLGDEPDMGDSMSITVPDTLVAVANGRLKSKIQSGSKITYTWAVVNPINNYNIIPYIGKYVTWHEDYKGLNGNLDCDYWVLDYNLQIAKEQFKAVDSMLKCFEFWMGPYPFYADGYKLVESPHLGMEHQSAVAYGNKFRQGYAGRDLSSTGWGLKWDFIIVHESGHEWFGNNITAKDLADEWIHESFTNYTETLYIGCYFGKEAANAYNLGIRKNIENKDPIVGYYGVNRGPEGTDEYYKGGNLLHTIRQVINNDSVFRELLIGLNKTFYHKTVTAKQIEDYFSQKAGFNFAPVFEQYLKTTQIPVLEYNVQGNQIKYRWTNCVKGFNLPAKVNGLWISPTEEWKSMTGEKFDVDKNLYIDTHKLS
jgi:aminopeptidase N